MMHSMAERGEDGACEVVRIDDDTIELQWRGYVTAPIVEHGRAELARLSQSSPPRFVLHDTLQVTGYDGEVRGPGKQLLLDFRQRGGVLMVAAVESVLIRMLATALGLAAGVPMRLYATRAEALVALRQRRPARTRGNEPDFH